MTITCQFCGALVEQYDATAGGADSSYSKGAAGTFDYPVTVECECGAEYCDGDLVQPDSGGVPQPSYPSPAAVRLEE